MSTERVPPTHLERQSCPGCGGRGIVVSLNTVLACGRCHGAGTIDLARERAEKARRDAEDDASALAFARKFTEMVRSLP